MNETLNDNKGRASSMRLALIIVSIGVVWIYVLISFYVIRFIVIGEHPDWVGLSALLGGPAIMSIGAFAAKAWQKRFEIEEEINLQDLPESKIQAGKELIDKIKKEKGESIPIVKGFKP